MNGAEAGFSVFPDPHSKIYIQSCESQAINLINVVFSFYREDRPLFFSVIGKEINYKVKKFFPFSRVFKLLKSFINIFLFVVLKWFVMLHFPLSQPDYYTQTLAEAATASGRCDGCMQLHSSQGPTSEQG